MEHLAIMNPAWELIPLILKGQKDIESRWYNRQLAPWDKIKAGELIYFKNSGGPVIARAEVLKVEQYANLDPSRIGELLDKYIERIGFSRTHIDEVMERIGNKHYGILTFLKNPQKVDPFYINKTGFASGSAWLSVENVNKLKR